MSYERTFFVPVVMPAAQVTARLLEWELRMKIGYEVRDAVSGELLTRAETIQVAVDAATGEMLYASPPVLRRRLGIDA